MEVRRLNSFGGGAPASDLIAAGHRENESSRSARGAPSTWRASYVPCPTLHRRRRFA